MAKCIITYKGVDYDYEDFAEKLHDGLLNELIKDGTIDSAKFTDKIEDPEKIKSRKEGLRIKRKVQGYNQLSYNVKKSEFGVKLRKELQKEAEDFGGSLKLLTKNKIQLVDSRGFTIKETSAKRDQSVIEREKREKKKRKTALNADTIDINRFIAQVVGRGGQFSESVTKEFSDVPSMFKKFKGGYSLDSLFTEYKSQANLEDANVDEFESKVMDQLGEYFGFGGRESAIEYAVEAYEKEINQGKTDRQLEDEVAYGESLGLPENKVQIINEAVDGLNPEEVDEVEIKIENKDEKERNEEFAREIIKDIAGEEGSDKNPLDENDVEQGPFYEIENEQDSFNEPTTDIIRGEGREDVFQKPKNTSLLSIPDINSSNLALKENGINGRLLNDKQVTELQKEIESNYINGDLTKHFNREKDDIRMKMFNYNHPIAEKTINGVNLRIAEGLIRDKKKTYLLYADGKIVGEFGSVQDAKNVVKYIEDNLINKNRIDLLQKPAELQYAEGQLKKAEIELTASKKALDAKRKELDKGITEDAEDLFGERKSTDATSLFDERVDLGAREEALAPFKQRYENAQKDFAKQTEKVKEIEDKDDAQTSLFQKKSVNKGAIDKVISVMQKAMPKVKIVYDEKLKAAGRWSPSNNTITVNPFYAGLDTPIHEAGHILIDAMGYNNKVIQSAIKQLRGTDLYAETKARYPELSEEQLDKEVLAEAIGREGANIFDKEADKSKFKAYLDYIYDWLKQKLGLDKNVAKSLAKQIIGGIGTKNLKGITGENANQQGEYLELVNGFYSPIEKTLRDFRQENQSATKWLNLFGKGDEVTYTGLRAYLESKRPDEQVKKSELQDYIKNNRIQIKEVVMGGNSEEDFMNRAEEAEKKFGVNITIDENPMDGSPDIQMSGEKLDDMSDDEIQELQDEVNDFVMAAAPETKFQQYQLEGEKEGYKEVLITLPRKVVIDDIDGIIFVNGQKTQFETKSKALDYIEKYPSYLDNSYSDSRQSFQPFKSSHFDDANIVVHLRMNIRKDTEGNKVLFLEEVQSDWGQQGKREGFRNKETELELNRLRSEASEAADKYREIDTRLSKYFSEHSNQSVRESMIELANRDVKFKALRAEHKLASDKKYEATQASYLAKVRSQRAVPSSPYVTDTNAWAKLGMKVALQHAVQEGATKIAWTTGEQQNDRYDLSKSVGEIQYSKNENGTYNVSATGLASGDVLMDKEGISLIDIENNFGKDIADKINNNVGDKSGNDLKGKQLMSLSGEGLKVGGKGMIGFYGSPKQGSLGIIGGIAEKLFGKGSVKTTEIYTLPKQNKGTLYESNVGKPLIQNSIDITPEMEMEVGRGLAQFQKIKPKKSPIGLRPLTLQQYASEHGFSYEAETEKFEEASENLNEAESNLKELQLSGTEEEVAEAEKVFMAAKKAFSIAGKKTFEYKKYRKDFAKVQEILNAKSLNDYTDVELQNLINELHGFGNRASKAFRDQAMIKLSMRAIKAQQKVFEGMEGYIEDLAKTKDISPLQKKILHHSHFSENNPDMQAVSLEFGKAIMDKITDANTKKATHEKLGQKVIAEENKKLGIVGAQANRFSSDSAKYFEWMINKDGELLTIDEAKNQGLSDAKINYLKFTRETIADYKGQLEEGDFENAVMDAIRIDKGFMEAYKSEGLLPAFSYYLGGGANNLGKVRIMYNGEIKSYSEIEKDILASADRKSIVSMAKALFDLLVANIMARKQLKRGFNVDEKQNPLELNAASEYSLNEKGQLMSKFDKPRAKDRGYSKDFYRAMNQFIDESAHAKHISKIMPLVDSVEYLNKNGYLEGGFAAKPNVASWIADWKALHIFKEPYVNDPVLDASIKLMRKLVASTTMWFNIPANVLNVFMGNYNSFKQENGKTLLIGNKRLFGGKDNRRGYGLDIIKKYNIVNQDYDSQPNMKAGSILSKLGTFGTQVGEYQIQGSLGLGLLSEEEFDSFEYTEDKYGNEILTLKKGVDDAKIKARMLQVKNRVTDIQGKYPDEDRRNIMRGEIGKAAFQFKVWMPDWFKERFSAKYINAYGVQKEGSFTQLMREGTKQIKKDIKDKGMTKALWENKAFMSNMKGLMTIGTLMALAHQDDDDDNKKKGALNFQNALSQVLFIFDLEQDKYMVSNPIAVLGKSKDLISAFDALVTNDETAFDKVRRVTPSNKALNLIEMVTK